MADILLCATATVLVLHFQFLLMMYPHESLFKQNYFMLYIYIYIYIYIYYINSILIITTPHELW